MLGFDVSDLTLQANLILVTTELLVLFYVAKWSVKPHSVATGTVLESWALISVGYFIRIGYWVLAIIAREDVFYKKCSMDLSICVTKVETYPDWALEYRGWLIIAAIFVCWGSLMFIRHIEGFKLSTKVSAFTAILALSTIPILVIN